MRPMLAQGKRGSECPTNSHIFLDFVPNLSNSSGILLLVADPLTRLITNGHSSRANASYLLIKVIREPSSKSVRKEERFRSLVRPITKAVKDKPHRNVRKNNLLPAGGGRLPGFYVLARGALYVCENGRSSTHSSLMIERGCDKRNVDKAGNGREGE